MSDGVLSIGTWRTNAELIADIATLPGYLEAEKGAPWTVFDATYGKHGGFWTMYRPSTLVTNDLRHPADHHWDFRDMPVESGAFDVVVYDPDYKLNGTPALGEQDERYGVDENLTRDERLTKIVAGACECYRVARHRLLVKCQDQVEGGIVRWQTDLITAAIAGLGGRKMDRFDFGAHRDARPQPEDRPCAGKTHRADPDGCVKCGGSGRAPVVQRTARHAGISQLLVFERRPLEADGQARLL